MAVFKSNRFRARIGSRLIAMLLIVAAVVPFLCGLPLNGVSAASDEGRDLSRYLELNYRFDDADLGADSSGKQRQGAFFGRASRVEDQSGRSVLFLDSRNHGVSEAYGTVPVEAVRHDEITLMAWMKFDFSTVGSYARVFAIETKDGRSLHLMAAADGEGSGYTAEIYTNASSRRTLSTEGMIPANVYDNWHHVALTYDGSEMKLYVNGAYINSAKMSAKISSWNVADAFLGKTGKWSNGTFNGYMDDVRIYSAALTEEEIRTAGEISETDPLFAVKLLDSLAIDGEIPGEFSVFADDYYRVLPSGTTTVPAVTAEAPCKGASVRIVPAERIPGTTEIRITYPCGAERTVTVRFTVSDVTLRHPEIEDVVIDDPFWNEKLKEYCEVTAPYVLKSWVSKTLDNLKNFDKVAAGHRNTKDYVGSMTWGESDFYASMAGACRLLRQYPNDTLKRLIDGYVDHIFAASESEASGYFSIYNLLMTDGKVFLEAPNAAVAMDLFNLGYLIEFGISYYEATGDARMLRVALRFLNFTVNYSNHGKKNFISFHPGVEYNIIALVEYLREKPEVLQQDLLKDLKCDPDDYLELAYHCLSYRGVSAGRVNNATFGAYGNDLIPYTKMRTAMGHIVEGTLYYFALAEYGRLTGELSTTNAAYRLWENLVNKQMYVTGGAGSIYSTEGFGGDYHMPNVSYTESCTSGVILQLSDSLSLRFLDGRYHDVAEKELYNNLLGSIGEEGTSFFYTNPLLANTSSRYQWHAVPCCTKYGLLIFGDLPRYLYAYSDDAVYVNQYIGSDASLALASGTVKLKQTSNWAEEGRASLTVTDGAEALNALYLRLPGWSETTSVLLNGKAVSFEVENGYAVLRGLKNGDTVSIEAEMTVKRVYADEHVVFDVGRVAVQKGPIVYCMEGIDNPATEQGAAANWLVLPKDSAFSEKRIEDLCGGVTALTAQAVLITEGNQTTPYTLTLIPFYARANRGAASVHVWLAEDPSIIETGLLSMGDSVELKTLGARYTAVSNITNPSGGSGNRSITTITDGTVTYGSEGQQFDSYGASLSDTLGKKQNIEWYGVRFNGDYGVTHVVFYEGGHWTNGGWFGESPTVQVLVNSKWIDVPFRMTPDYPGDQFIQQMPSNEAYTFTLSEPVVCRGIRVLGKQNTASGKHTSCTEITVYGMAASDVPTVTEPGETTANPAATVAPNESEPIAPEPSSEMSPAIVVLLAVAACGVSLGATYVILQIVKKKK